MTVEQRKESWKREEEIARIHGWDFSHIHGRYTEEDDLPWDFGKIIQKYRNDSMKLMDMETGGGEFLLTFRKYGGDRRLSAECGTVQKGFAPVGN